MSEQGQGGLLWKGVTPRCDRIIVESEAQPLGGVLVESPGAFMSAKEGSGSACALRRRPTLPSAPVGFVCERLPAAMREQGQSPARQGSLSLSSVEFSGKIPD